MADTKTKDEFSLEEDDLFEDFDIVEYQPGTKEADDGLWEPEWDDEGKDGEFLNMIKEELQKSAAKK